MPEATWTLRGADERLTLVERPQPGCVDLVLDGRTEIAWVTGRGQPVPAVLAAAGVAFLQLGDPDGPLAPPAPLPDQLARMLSELLAAVDATGVIEHKRAPSASSAEMPGRIAPPLPTPELRNLSAMCGKARLLLRRVAPLMATNPQPTV